MTKLATTLILLLVANLARAEDDGDGAKGLDLARQGSEAMAAGDMTGALANFEALAAEGHVNGHLYYNMGIAAYRVGHLSDAVAAFLAARRFLPRDPDVAANLRFVLGRIPDKLQAQPPRGADAPVAFLLDSVTARELAIFLGLLIGTVGSIMLATVVRPALAPWRRHVLIATILPALAAVLLALKLSRPEVWGSVAGPSARVHAAAGEQNAVLFELREGAPVLVEERGASGYLKIQLSDGKSGWIAGSQVKIVGPQFGAPTVGVF